MDNLVKKVVAKLIKKKLTISFAESCSGGLLSSYVTSIAGASKIFNLGKFCRNFRILSKGLKIIKY